MRTRALAQATWTELPPCPTVLVPLGSTEQHGPHLPVSTDTVIATAVADALADRLDAQVAPALVFGASGEHQGFPGVISLGTDVLVQVIIESIRSLSLWAGHVVLVNGHGGNVQAIRTALSHLITEGHDVTWVPCQAPGDSHAGHTETSIMLHLAPDLVAIDRIEAGNTTPLEHLLSDLRADGVQPVSPNGVLGDPTGANATEGSALFAQMLEAAHRVL